MDPTDATLLQQAVAGDDEAVSTLLERHGPAVRRRLAGRIPARWQSVLTLDDVMQQTYAEAILAIRTCAPHAGASLEPWLATIAGRNLLDALRMLESQKRGGRKLIPAGARGSVRDQSSFNLCEALGMTTNTPSRGAARGEARAALLAAVERLPPVQRRVVEMYDLEDKSAEEVAAAIGRSIGALYMLRARAHRALSQILGTVSAYLTRA